MFLFDARRMLLSLMCADECSVTWPYLLVKGDTDGIVAPDNLETIRAEFASVVEERRRRELCRPVLVSDFRALQRETSNLQRSTDTIVEQNKQMEEQNQLMQDQMRQMQEQNQMMQEQMRQMQEQNRHMHALLMSREPEPSANADERDKRAAKRRRTGR
jgi:septal ring factor EnvC (AmiA/AmiB activator)